MAWERRFRLSVTLVALAGVGSLTFPLAAQDYEKVAPKTPPRSESPAEISPLAPAEGGDDTVLVDRLRGIVFLKDPAQVQPTGVAAMEGIRAEGLDVLRSDAFRKLADRFLGQPLTMRRLNRLAGEVVRFYRRNRLALADVIVPSDQDITNGVVQVLVFESRLGQLVVEGNRWFDDGTFRRQMPMRPGDRLYEDEILSRVGWLNHNPFRHVEPVLGRGKEVGTTDLHLRVQDRFPARFYAGYEDTGTDLTGDERWFTGLNWGDALALDHQLNYQFTTSSDFVKMVAHSGSYVIPLPWRHTLSFFGSHARSKADVDPQIFKLTGRSWQTSGRYAIPLHPVWEINHVATAGFDFKQSNNNLEFGGAQVFNTTTEVLQWVVDYQVERKDPWGQTSWRASGVYSPGRLTERNHDAYFLAARGFAKAEYSYGRFELERSTRLPADFTWRARGVYQVAEANLLGSEQLGLGGSNTVRGYEEREANGDSGYLISTEIRTPPISLGAPFGVKDGPDQFQFLAFWDYGSAENHARLPGEDPHNLLSSVGPGMRYTINPWLSVRFDYGWQLYDTALSTRFNSRGHLGIMIAY